MATTAPTTSILRRPVRPREMPRWCAGILAIAGNIAILGILLVAAALPLAAAALIFGTALLAQL